MLSANQIAVPATYMRGGTSKGVFFRLEDLPERCRTPGPSRDKFLQRVIGSPDPYGAQIDGMGGATSSTSKCAIVSPSTQPDHDVDFLFGQVSIDSPLVDWSGNCGNLSAAAGALAIHAGYVDAAQRERDGICTVRLWQANIGKTIIAHIPVANGKVREAGDFVLDGVAFPAAEIILEMIDPIESDGPAGPGQLFPTGNLVDNLQIPTDLLASGALPATLINAGIPTIFVKASDLGYSGTELRDSINNDPAALKRLEKIRAIGGVAMGLFQRIEDAVQRQHTPKLAFVAPPAAYDTSAGTRINVDEIDLLVRAMSMGKLHHAMMGTAAVAIAAAASIPGTIVNQAIGGSSQDSVCFGHPSGTLRVGAEASSGPSGWSISKATMSRSARILMHGTVHVPTGSF